MFLDSFDDKFLYHSYKCRMFNNANARCRKNNTEIPINSVNGRYANPKVIIYNAKNNIYSYVTEPSGLGIDIGSGAIFFDGFVVYIIIIFLL